MHRQVNVRVSHRDVDRVTLSRDFSSPLVYPPLLYGSRVLANLSPDTQGES